MGSENNKLFVDDPNASISSTPETLESVAVHDGETLTVIKNADVTESPPEMQTTTGGEDTNGYTESHGIKFLAPKKNKFARIELGNAPVSPTRERTSYLWNQKDSNAHM